MEMADVYGVKTRGQGDACAFFTQRETRGDVMPASTRGETQAAQENENEKFKKGKKKKDIRKRYHTALIQFLQCHCKSVFEAHPPPPPSASP